MRKRFGWSSIVLLAIVVMVWVSNAAAISPVLACSSVTGLSLPNTKILSATEIATPVPYCAVIGIINERVSTQDPDHFTYGIGFQVNLPDSWVGRFEMEGGSGTDGTLHVPLGVAGFELKKGWAVASDDGGHEDTANPALGNYSDDDVDEGGPSHFAVDDQARLDYGYNGVAQTTAIAKAIIAAYYGQGPRYSYFWGCSNGGRDALVAAHRLADDYDGIVAGNPGFDLPRADIAGHWNEQALVPLSKKLDSNNVPYIGGTLQPQDLEVASAAILQACDALDGLIDGIVDDYSSCTTTRVNEALANFTCTKSSQEHQGTCLTPNQIAALNKIMAGPVNSEGTHLYSGWYWDAGIWDPTSAKGFHFWNVAEGTVLGDTNNSHNLTKGAGSGAMVYTVPPELLTPGGLESFVFNFNFDTDANAIFETAPGYSQSAMQFMTGSNWGESADLTEFKSHGGKLIIYSSVNDGVFSGVDIVDYYNQIDSFFGGASDFARLFMVPNMAHCSGGPATDDLKGPTFEAITAWTEKGMAPSQIIAGNTDTTSPFPSGFPFNSKVAEFFPTGGTRPLCPYPQQTRYSGKGSSKEASSFVCFTPPGENGGSSAVGH